MAKTFYPENNTLRPVETEYNGHRMRSRLEARWATFFDHLGIRWQYETERYRAGEKTYLPDFFLPDQNTYVEIKPLKRIPEKCPVIYLAGKVSRDDWRHRLVHQLRGAEWAEARYLRNGYEYAGPYFTSCDHGCAHGPQAVHGAEEDCCIGSPIVGSQTLVKKCLYGIRRSDITFAWIDSREAYGTLAEIGYAKGVGAQLWVAMKQSFSDEIQAPTPSYHHTESDPRPHDLWFVMQMADKHGYFDFPEEALAAWTPTDDPDLVPMRAFARTNHASCLLIRGTPDPHGDEYEAFAFNGDYDSRPSGNLVLDTSVPTRTELAWIRRGMITGETDERLKQAMSAGRRARFEYGERG